MRDYVYGIICVSVAIGVAELLIPENMKTKPYLKLIFGLAMLLVTVKPLGELVNLIPQIGESFFEESIENEDYSEIATEQLAQAYKAGISKDLETSFGLSDFDVGVVLEDNKPVKITVVLMGSDIFRNPYKIEEHIKNAFGCECITLIGG